MVAYLRVSRESQGADGLGIQAQKTAVASHVESQGCELIASYTEVETAKKHSLDNRPALRKAIAHAKRSRATLVVAKLDRLIRSTVVCSLLKTSGVKFQACDNPHANELTIDILAAVAEDEVRRISARTSAALQALKSRGVLLGSHRPECANNLNTEAASRGRAIGAARKKQIATDAYADLAVDVAEMRENGLSLRAIAEALNNMGETTRTGKAWGPMQVSRVLERT
jgi:DNA invertase Pin-like site-specific DNA recombinase